MTRAAGAMEKVRRAVMEWEGVTVEPHRFGGIEFRQGRRELGHLHGDSLVDIPFPMKIRNELVEAQKVMPHHILPKSGWISFAIEDEGSIAEAIALLRRSFELAKKSKNQSLEQTEEKDI